MNGRTPNSPFTVHNSPFIILFFFLTLLSVLAWYDISCRRLPHWLTLPGLIGVVVGCDALPAETRPNALLGGVFAFLLFLIIYQTKQLGFGDVMLAALIGAAGGIQHGLFALAIGMLFAGGYAAVGLMRGRFTRDSTMPYGLFLVMGAIPTFLIIHLAYLGQWLGISASAFLTP